MSKRKEIIVSKALANRAFPVDNVIVDHTDCESCTEEYLFHFSDGKNERYIGLRTILKCFETANNSGDIAQIPIEWWLAVKNRYGF